MDETIDMDKVDDIMMPGFRFHPTDEELVGFYLKRKIQQRTLPIELIKQVDIYKYDPWDLPKLTPSGEKEWYFYCPRDRKYRNSARPNRVTGSGFWKATGTDRPIYASDGSNKCIGLKKSLVFYRGRAAKGIKTDWMMHEFRLPSLVDSQQSKKPLDKAFPANDAWAICRIFKKTSSMAQRQLSQTWVSPEMFNQNTSYANQFNSSCATTETGSVIQLNSTNDPLQQQQPSTVTFSSPDHVASYKAINQAIYKSHIANENYANNFMFSPLETRCKNAETSSSYHSLMNDMAGKGSDSINFGGQNGDAFSLSLQQDIQGGGSNVDEEGGNGGGGNQWGNVNVNRPIGFPFNLPQNLPDAWKNNLAWDSTTCPSEMSSNYSTK